MERLFGFYKCVSIIQERISYFNYLFYQFTWVNLTEVIFHPKMGKGG